MDAPERLEQELSRRGFEVHRDVIHAGEIREDVVHDRDEILVLFGDAIEIDLAGIQQRPSAGEEILIPALTVHTIRNVGDDDVRALHALS